MRDRSQSKLEEEGARLSALLETARTQSRIVGTDVRWEPLTDGRLPVRRPAAARPPRSCPRTGSTARPRATIVGAPQLRLGPEPLLPAQRVVLHLGDREIAVGTDGLSPFQIVDGSADTAAAQ